VLTLLVLQGPDKGRRYELPDAPALVGRESRSLPLTDNTVSRRHCELVPEDGGQWVKIPQIGSVRIGDDVEIGANTTIDRGTMSDTVIEDGVKLDNQIQVGHNVRIGAHTAVAGCAGIAGSTEIGKGCVIGAAAGILGHLKIVDGVRISACTTISHSILKPGTYTGLYPFDDNQTWARNTAVVRRLAELWDRVRALEAKGKKNG
jgi:UDP-3-O-[3-hydroxymyristoyl] glucosamine N-acyltransferase